MKQVVVAAGIFLLSFGAVQAGPTASPSAARIAQLTEALKAGDVAAAHDMTTSFLSRKVSLYAFQGMMETGGIFGQEGSFQFDRTEQGGAEGAELSMLGRFVPADGSAARPVRFSWLLEDGEWRLNRFGF